MRHEQPFIVTEEVNCIKSHTIHLLSFTFTRGPPVSQGESWRNIQTVYFIGKQICFNKYILFYLVLMYNIQVKNIVCLLCDHLFIVLLFWVFVLKGLLVLSSWMALELKSTAVSVHIGIEGTSMHFKPLARFMESVMMQY